jgi:hypothetical protein
MIQAKGKEYWFDPAANQDPVPGLLKKASALYAAYDPAAYQLAGSAEREQFGFGFGEPYLIAQYLGVMDHFGALTDGDRRSAEKRLMANFKFGIFGSTFENANVVLATRELLKREAKELRAGAGDRRVLGADGSLLGVVAPIPGGYSGTLLALSNSKALQSLSIEGLRPQELVTAYAEVAVPFKEVSSQARGISVVRELRKITPTGSAVLLEGQELSVGDVVVSKVRVTRDDAPHTGNLSAFVVLEDGIPSFAEGIEEDRTYLADAKIAPDAGSVWGEVKDTLRYPDRTERVLKVVPGGIVDTVQVWRVGYAGTATIPPAKAFDMYNAELQGNSPPLTVQAVR